LADSQLTNEALGNPDDGDPPLFPLSSYICVAYRHFFYNNNNNSPEAQKNFKIENDQQNLSVRVVKSFESPNKEKEEIYINTIEPNKEYKERVTGIKQGGGGRGEGILKASFLSTPNQNQNVPEHKNKTMDNSKINKKKKK